MREEEKEKLEKIRNMVFSKDKELQKLGTILFRELCKLPCIYTSFPYIYGIRDQIIKIENEQDAEWRKRYQSSVFGQSTSIPKFSR